MVLSLMMEKAIPKNRWIIQKSGDRLKPELEKPYEIPERQR
jgi:hypothetical protein